MSFSLSSNYGKSAGKVLVAILLASTATACSSDTTRFSGLFAGSPDQVTTGSINRRGLNGPDGDPVPRADLAQGGGYQQQDYSQQNAPVTRPYPNSPARYNPSYSSARVSTAPVAIQRTELAAPTASAAPVRTHVASRGEAEALAQPFPASRGKAAVSRAEPALAPDTMPTGTIKAAPAAASSSGWTAVNAPSVTLRPGENISLLSRRYGVPEKEILRANGLKNSASAQPGQQIIIPTMNGAGAPGPAKMASEATDLSKGGKMPAPVKAPEQDAVVLPSNGQMRGKSQAGLADPGKLAAGNGKGPHPKGDGTYVVKPGDSLARIAKNAGVSVDELKQANHMQQGGGIRIGQTLKLPHGAVAEAESARPDPVKTASIEPQKSAVKSVAVPATEPKQAAAESTVKPAAKTAAAKTAAAEPAAKAASASEAAKPQAVAAATPTQSVGDAAAKADVQADAPEATGIGKYRWPVRGAVIAGYGSNVNGSRNDGIDISVPEGTPIKAAENGVVIYAGNGLKELGNTVLVRHDDGTVTVYGHADALSVARGQKVQRGQTLATSGMSGDVKQPQLHFEVRKNSAPVNPMTFLE
ncbi:LysM peptidoglycan-binding domain-containing M23 family metallopeptidase [Rhizobium sp. CB3090]|uniref:LysM peptidoglycan-binding domain-containing M23 family metallopeptidase n=1 Tax=Rhizobium sp. CB3090 TaxID=3039156 RepID=UPI0024B2336F|nr:LysM peptidoglycan-binding domain-containing M23 family metallopeptidase [Rhizobium sp. CB3090]WFU10418.1 LysM peptidoglycan-binding domain-containing M23 family metallopeptidase [Rhizobium sp. CB3090]